MITELRSREFRITELFFKGFEVFRNNLKSILIITLLINIPIDIIQTIFFSLFQQTAVTESSYTLAIIRRCFGLLLLIPQFLANLATVVIVEQYVLNGNINYTAGSALRKSFSRFPASFGTSALAGLLAAFFFLLFIIPGIIFTVNQYFITQVTSLRNLRGCLKSQMSSKKALRA